MGLPYAQSIVEDQAPNLWVAGPELLNWNPREWRAYYREQLEQYHGLAGIEAIAADPDGSLWVGFGKTGLGLQHFVAGAPAKAAVAGMNASNLQVQALMMDRSGSLWIGTIDDGIYRIHGGRVDHFRSEDGLSGNSVECFYADREGSIWLITSKGLDQFRDTPITTLSTQEGLTADKAASVLASRDGTIWIGNQEALDILRGGQISSIRPRNGLPGHRISSLYEDSADRIWVGVDGQLTICERGSFTQIARPDGSALGVVTAIVEDVDHDVWAEVVGKDRRLFRIRDLRVRDEFTTSQVPYSRVIAADPTGGIWLESGGKLGRYQGGTLEIVSLNQGSLELVVSGLLVDPGGLVWVTTQHGLYGWMDGRAKSLTSKNGLPCDDLISVIRDEQKTLWITARCGLIGISEHDLERWWKQPDTVVTVRNLDAFDGALPSKSTFQPNISRSPDGRIWFANDSIVQVFDRRNLKKNPVLPPVHIEQVIADRTTYSPGEDVRLPPRTRDLEIDYTALSLVVPQKVHFRYKLDRRDAGWQDPGTRRQAFYSDLPPGEYRFHVIACNNDGVWNEAGATLNFTVMSAYYQRWWFRLLCLCLGLTVLIAVYWLRIRQIAGVIKARFDERLAERTRIARDIHDTLLQTIQGCKMVADDALGEPADEARMRHGLERMSVWLAQAIDEGRSALTSLRDSTTEKNDLAKALEEAGDDLTFSRPIEFALTVEGSSRDMHPIVRDEVYWIGYEAIRNSCLHSCGSRLKVELSYLDDLLLHVGDNGKGIDPDAAAEGNSGHFGVIGMYERAARVRGRLTLSSSPGVGTSVKLAVPDRIAFLQPVQSKSLAWIRRMLR
jgi:signal transduction histidine kinase/streptogramin lyase